jgi:hypothetical protein
MGQKMTNVDVLKEAWTFFSGALDSRAERWFLFSLIFLFVLPKLRGKNSRRSAVCLPACDKKTLKAIEERKQGKNI